MSEHLVLMRALRDMNLPKFVYDDVPLFLGLVNDLFPGVEMSACVCECARVLCPWEKAWSTTCSKVQTRLCVCVSVPVCVLVYACKER